MARSIRNYSPTKLGLVVAVGILLIGVTLAILEKTHITNFFGQSNAPNSTQGPSRDQIEQEQKTNSQQKQDYLDGEYGNKNQDQTGTQAPGLSESSVDLSAVQQGISVIVTAKMKSLSSGSCKLTASNNGKTVEQTAGVIYQPEFSSCAGFSMPVSDLGTGTWNINLSVSASETQQVNKTISLVVR